MVKIIFLTFLLLFSGCALNKENVLTVQSSSGEIKYGHITYHIVEDSELNKARKSDTLTYVGSTDNFHLMRVWSKIAPVKGEIHFFAINKSGCSVCGESSPEAEQLFVETNRKGWREVILIDDHCKVNCRKTIE